MIIAGERYGKLVAVKPTSLRKFRYTIWEVKCDCGSTSYLTSQEFERKKKCKVIQCYECGRNKYKGENVMDIAKKSGISYNTIMGRIRNGVDIYKPQKKGGCHRYDVGLDKPYSFSELSEMTGINRTTILQRWKRGMRGRALLIKPSKPLTKS